MECLQRMIGSWIVVLSNHLFMTYVKGTYSMLNEYMLLNQFCAIIGDIIPTQTFHAIVSYGKTFRLMI